MSFSAQYQMVHAARGLPIIAALEAAIPDAAALVFASLGIALALHGRRAVRTRLLNVASVATSVAMNALAAPSGRARQLPCRRSRRRGIRCVVPVPGQTARFLDLVVKRRDPWRGFHKWFHVERHPSPLQEIPRMTPALYLIDASAVFRILQAELRKAWSDQLAAGVIAICPIVELEFLCSARSLADRLEKQRLLHDLFGRVSMNERSCERASEVQQLLTESGAHRSAVPAGLLIAATAERERLIVLCDDHDYQTVAAVTGQPVKLVTDI